jgi:hypothetical protein
MSEVLAKFQELIRRGYEIGTYSQKRNGYEYELTQASATIKIPVKTRTSELDNMVKSVLDSLRQLGYNPSKPIISGNKEHVYSTIQVGRWDPFTIGQVEIRPKQISLTVNPGTSLTVSAEKNFLKHLSKLTPYLNKLIEDNKGN